MRLLGIDHGDSRIGLSISDELASFAHPYRTLQRDPQVFHEIRQIVERERIRCDCDRFAQEHGWHARPICRKGQGLWQ